MDQYSVVVAVSVAVLAAVIATRLASLASRLDRLGRIEGKLDALLAELDVKYDPWVKLPADVRDALARGQRIEAIKRLRTATGLGLKDAKDRIDDAQQQP